MSAELSGVPIAEIEETERSRGFSLKLPGKIAGGPERLRLSYRVATSTRAPADMIPSFSSDVAIQDVKWLILVPWNWSILGSPNGWQDGNEWFWDKYLFRRRPMESSQRLSIGFPSE